jgi:hypothetical protein
MIFHYNSNLLMLLIGLGAQGETHEPCNHHGITENNLIISFHLLLIDFRGLIFTGYSTVRR